MQKCKNAKTAKTARKMQKCYEASMLKCNSARMQPSDSGHCAL